MTTIKNHKTKALAVAAVLAFMLFFLLSSSSVNAQCSGSFSCWDCLLNGNCGAPEPAPAPVAPAPEPEQVSEPVVEEPVEEVYEEPVSEPSYSYSCTPGAGCLYGGECGGYDECGNYCGNDDVGAGCPYGGGCGGTDYCGNSCGEGYLNTPGKCGIPLLDCCGDSSDPCGWWGDDTCDVGCAWGTDIDCKPSCTPSCSYPYCGQDDGCGGVCSSSSVGSTCLYGGECGGYDECGNYCGNDDVGTGCPYGGGCGGTDYCDNSCGEWKLNTPGQCGNPSCDYSPQCSSVVDSSNSNCGATRTTDCNGGCTGWSGGVSCGSGQVCAQVQQSGLSDDVDYACVECSPGSTESIACTANTCQAGTKTRTCTSYGSWGGFGECIPTGASSFCQGSVCNGKGVCVECVGNNDCKDPLKSVCDPSTNVCVECVGADASTCGANGCMLGDPTTNNPYASKYECKSNKCTLTSLNCNSVCADSIDGCYGGYNKDFSCYPNGGTTNTQTCTAECCGPYQSQKFADAGLDPFLYAGYCSNGACLSPAPEITGITIGKEKTGSSAVEGNLYAEGSTTLARGRVNKITVKYTDPQGDLKVGNNYVSWINIMAQSGKWLEQSGKLSSSSGSGAYCENPYGATSGPCYTAVGWKEVVPDSAWPDEVYLVVNSLDNQFRYAEPQNKIAPVTVYTPTCVSDAQCGAGRYCDSDFICRSCSNSPNQCQAWADGCGTSNLASGTSCETGNPAKEFCDGAGSCIPGVIKAPRSETCNGQGSCSGAGSGSGASGSSGSGGQGSTGGGGPAVVCALEECNENGACVASGSLSSDGFAVCTDGDWVGIDDTDAACSAVGGKRARVGEPSVSAISQFGAVKKLIEGNFKCSRPGGPYFRTRDCAQGVCSSDATDAAICDKATDCVFNGRCFSDIDDVIASPSLGLADRGIVWKNGLWKDEVSSNVNSNSILEYCDPGEWQGDPEGDLQGTVANITHVQPGVTVTIVGTGMNDVTDASGNYLIEDVSEGTYDIVAQHPDPAYETATSLDVSIDAFSTTTHDITLTHPNENCNDDCTMSDGLCHAECQGKGLCAYSSPETQSACDLAAPGIVDDPFNPGQQIVCCTGGTFEPVPANVEVCGDNVISLKKPVLFKGKLVNMVLTVFNAGECDK